MTPGNASTQTKVVIGCNLVLIIGVFITTVVLSLRYVGSPNPIDVFSEGSQGQVVTVSVLLVFLSLLALGALAAFLQHVRTSARAPDPRLLGSIGMGVLLGIALILSYATTGSLNPVDVFRDGKTWAVVASAVVLLLLAISLIKLIGISVIIWSIESRTGKSYRDVYCKFCDEPILQTRLGVQRRAPAKCPHCKDWVHLDCWREHGGNLAHRCPDPKCEPSVSMPRLDDLLGML